MTVTQRSAALQDQQDISIVSHLPSLIIMSINHGPTDSGHYPMPMGGGYGQFPPPLPPPRGARSIASSKGSSYAGGAPRMPPYGGMPYGYLPNMYYGYHPPYAVSSLLQLLYL